MKDKEQRYYVCPLNVRLDEKRGNVIEGIPIVYGKRTDLYFFQEEIRKGALDGTELKDVLFLINHDTGGVPLARSRNNNENSTMQLWIEEDGLHMRACLDTENNPRAKEIYSAVERGDISGMSFMFTVDEEEWQDLDSDHPVRYINKISRVFEVSAVSWPAYEDTSISARKAPPDGGKEALESVLKIERMRYSVKERSLQLCKKD